MTCELTKTKPFLVNVKYIDHRMQCTKGIVSFNIRLIFRRIVIY